MIRQGFIVVLTLLIGVVSLAAPVAAQGRFSPELQVGDSIVTRYQIDQRAIFLTLLGAPGDVRNLAREQLINEALQLAAAREQQIEVTPEQVDEGISEFAARANLTADQFLTITQERGISQATVRDFFIAGVAWRETIRARFGEALQATIDESQARRALALNGTEGGVRVLLSEILLPANTPETQRASMLRATELMRLTDPGAFSTAARQFSIAASSSRGGELGWAALDSLPVEVRSTIGALRPGQVSRPLTLENSIGIYLMRDMQTVAAGTPDSLAIDYALFVVSGGSAEAQRVAGQVDVCDDFYGIARGLPAERLVRETKQISAIPADLRAALAGLDEGEISTSVTRGGNATVLMLCQRQPAIENAVDLEIAGNRILNVRLGTAAAHYLSQLRAETEVIDFATN